MTLCSTSTRPAKGSRYGKAATPCAVWQDRAGFVRRETFYRLGVLREI